MRSEIIENINKTLQKSLEKERVAYLMIEIRKFIEHSEEEGKKWPTLKYWGDWTLHTSLDRKFARETLTKMESYLIENPGDKFHWSDFNMSFISLESLRLELYNFLKINDLPLEILNIPEWDNFCKFIVEILRDCPLEKNDGLLRKLVFIKKPHGPRADKYSIDYKICFDGSRNDIEGSILRFEEEDDE
jgi:hypothetical protein